MLGHKVFHIWDTLFTKERTSPLGGAFSLVVLCENRNREVGLDNLNLAQWSNEGRMHRLLYIKMI